MRLIALLCAFVVLAFGSAAGASETAHYEVRARLSAAGVLLGDVSIETPPDEIGEDGEISFLLGRRFDLLLARSDGAEVEVREVDEPIPGLRRITFRFPGRPAAPALLRLQYEGPVDPGGDGVKPMTADRVELFLDQIWLPVRDDISMRFTAETWLTGVAGDLVVVAQGAIEHDAAGVHVRRDFADVDLPLVAARGLVVHAAPGLEFYAPETRSRLVDILQRQSVAAARYMADWFGPPREPVRMVVVSRPQTMAYARAGYTVLSDGGEAVAASAETDFPEANPARHVAHEIAHAWWSPADPLGEHYWLSESVAEYAALRYVRSAFGEADYERLVAGKRQRAAGTGPLLQGRRPSGVQLYQLGPLLLIDLEDRIGRRAMDETLARLGRAPPSTTADFLAVLAEVAGAEAAAGFERTLRTDPGPAAPAPPAAGS